jgi:hypothetical protein
MPFGQIVVGPPGSGKTTYCNGMAHFFELTGRSENQSVLSLFFNLLHLIRDLDCLIELPFQLLGLLLDVFVLRAAGFVFVYLDKAVIAGKPPW